MSMLASIYSDLIEGDRPIDMECPTGNCTFTRKLNPEVSYQTLGFESECVDFCKEVRAETQDSLDTWYIPRTGTKSTPRFTALMFNVDRSHCEDTWCQTSTDMPLAVECKIWPVILTIKSRVESAQLYETIAISEPLQNIAIMSKGFSEIWLASPDPVLRDGACNPCSGSSVKAPDRPVQVGTNKGHSFTYSKDCSTSRDDNVTWYAQDCVWGMDPEAVVGLRGTFRRMYQDQTLISSSQNVSGSSGEAWLELLYHNVQSNLSTVEAYASQIARAMTKQTRRIMASNDPEYGLAKGTVMETDTCIQVRWAWLIFPASLIALTIIFLATTIWKTRRGGRRGRPYGIWKSSSLAVLLGGLQEEARGTGALERKSDMERHAKEMEVSLRPVDGGWRLG